MPYAHSQTVGPAPESADVREACVPYIYALADLFTHRSVHPGFQLPDIRPLPIVPIQPSKSYTLMAASQNSLETPTAGYPSALNVSAFLYVLSAA